MNEVSKHRSDMRKRLILGPIPDDFSPENDVPIGAFCFSGRERIYPEWQGLSFEFEPFVTQEDVSRACSATVSYANSKLPELSESMNRRLSTDFSSDFWRIILMPWFLALVQAVWERQCRIERVLKRFGEEPLTVEIFPEEIDCDIQETLDIYEKALFNPLYNIWVFSTILRKMAPKCWQLRETMVPLAETRDGRRRERWTRSIRKKIEYHSRCAGVYGMTLPASLAFGLLLVMMKKRRTTSRDVSSGKGSADDIRWQFDFERVMNSSIPKKLLDKDFVSRKYRSKPGKLNLIGPLLWYDEEKKVRLAKAREGGERIVVTQHGGNYGNAKTYPMVSETEYKMDAFLTWGWTEQEDYAGNFYPLPSPYLNRFHFRRNNEKRESNLIFVGTLMQLYTYRLDAMPLSSQILQYRDDKIRFLESLKKGVAENTLYRPYKQGRGCLEDETYVTSRLPYIRMLDGNFHKKILNAKLLVVDHPGTTLNIGMVSNIPIVSFWNPALWAMSRQAESYFSRLEEVGLLFDDPVKAARQINAIWADIPSWWNSPRVQEARRHWCDRFARTGKQWWWDWAHTLRNLK